MLKLIIEDDEGRKTVVPFVRDEITIGRQEGNTIRLTERNVSRRHARLLRQNGHVLIEDLGSYNGIRVNGDRIKGQVTIADGDLVQIGDYDLAIQREEEKAAAPTVPLTPAAAPARTSGSHKTHDPGATVPALPVVEAPVAADEDIQEAAPEDIKPALGEEPPRNQSTAVIRIDQVQGNRAREVKELDAADAPRLVVLNTDFAGREFPCTKTEMRIGRTDENDVGLDHRSLSRTHCKVVREETGEWRVIDMQSANGVMVNGEQYAQVALNPGDVIELGHVKLKFLAPGETYTPPAPGEAGHAAATPSGGSSRAPIIAVVVALLVIVLGGGGYMALKGPPEPPKGNGTRPVKPVKDPRVDGPGPEVPAAGLTKAELEAKLAEARTAIAALDFDKAEVALKACRVGDSLHAEANQLLVQMDGERGFRNALAKAAEALALEDEKAAKAQLDAASQTKLLRDKYEELERARAKLVEKKLAAVPKQPVQPVQPVKQPVVAAGGLKPEAQKQLDEARPLVKQGQYQAAINRLEKCLKIDNKAFDCHKLLGSAYAKKGAAENNAEDVKKGLAHYERFVELAPPDDESVPKVRKIIEQYKNSPP